MEHKAMKTTLLATVFVAISSHAFALTEPTPSPRDPRLVTATCSDDIIAAHGSVGQVFAIEFNKGESAEGSWLSDTVDVQSETDGNLLVLKPMREMSPQPIVVYTRTPGGDRRRIMLQWDVVRDREGTRPYALRIAPCSDNIERERKAAAEKYKEEHKDDENIRAINFLRTEPSDTGVVNKHYVGIGDYSLLPSRQVWDDGQATYLRFPGNTSIPPVYIVSPDGTEAVTPYYADTNGTITINQVVRGIKLRYGDSTLCIWNQAFDPIGVNHRTGTKSKKVVRVVKKG